MPRFQNAVIRHASSNGNQILLAETPFSTLRYVGKSMTEIGQFNGRPLVKVGRFLQPEEQNSVRIMTECKPLNVVIHV